MSFFGFDTTLPRDRPSGQQTRGIFENPDPFAHVAHAVVQDDEEAYISLSLLRSQAVI